MPTSMSSPRREWWSLRCSRRCSVSSLMRAVSRATWTSVEPVSSSPRPCLATMSRLASRGQRHRRETVAAARQASCHAARRRRSRAPGPRRGASARPARPRSRSAARRACAPGRRCAASGRRGRPRSRSGRPPPAGRGRSRRSAARPRSPPRGGRAPRPRRRRGRGTTSRSSGTRFAVGIPSSRPRRSPLTTSPSNRNGPPRNVGGLRPPRRRPRGRGCGSRTTVSPATSTSGTTRVSNSVVRARSSSASPSRTVPEAEVLAHRHAGSAPSRPTSTSSTNSSALREAKSRSKGITTSSSTPRPAIRSRLMAKRREQLGQRPRGGSPPAGAGRRSARCRCPAITSRWPRWTPSKVPIATARGALGGRHVGEAGDLHAGANTTTGWSSPSRGSAIATSSPARGEAQRRPRPRPAAGSRPAVPHARRPRRSSSGRSGRNASASASGTSALGVGVLQPEAGRSRVRSSSSQ